MAPRPAPRSAALALGIAVLGLAACAPNSTSPSPSAGLPSDGPVTTSAPSSQQAQASGPATGASAVASAGGDASLAPGATPPLTGGRGPVQSGPANDLQAQFESIVQTVNPSVVVIETSEGLGSGVVFDDRGNIVTNAHVAGTATSFKVTTSDGKTYNAKLVGLFTPDDVAVIHVDGATPPAASFGNSSDLRLGDIVLAIGNPLGLQSSVTEGIVSATGRTVSEPSGNSIPNMIQTSAAINPGNSGGALVDLSGEVIGIPTLAASDPQMGGSAPGIGFAVSSNMAADIARQLVTNGKVTNSHRAYLGVQLADTQQAAGALIARVVPNGPAAKAGLQAGDLITAAGGKTIQGASELSDLLASLPPGGTVDLLITAQDGSEHKVTVTLGEFPAQG